VYQFVGVVLFISSMAVCCGSSLISKDVAERRDLIAVGWTAGPVFYSAQRAITVSLLLAVFYGMALAGIGLGLQAQSRKSPYAAATVAASAAVFWAIQAVFFAGVLGSLTLPILCTVISLIFLSLTALAIAAVRDMLHNPPPPGHELLPPDYQVPYSHLHQDPPEIRLARELEQRRERLAVQQKELEMLEARLRRKLESHESPDPPPPPATSGQP
jgi:hypothetical protein